MNFEQLVANTNHLAHAHLVEGPDVKDVERACLGFTSLLICTNRLPHAPEPCGTCQSCQLNRANNHPDILSIGQEGLSVGVDEVRRVATFLAQKPHIAGKQIVLVYNADKMTTNAANAVLKTLEEPSDNSYILLMSENRHNQMATIRSRCQIWPIEDLASQSLSSSFDQTPKYIVGFAGGVQSKLARWQAEGEFEQFEQIYEVFLRWLKGHAYAGDLAEPSVKQELQVAFLLYLFERRIRQLMLKGAGQKAIDAHQKLTQYLGNKDELRNQSAQVALTNFILELEYLIR